MYCMIRTVFLSFQNAAVKLNNVQLHRINHFLSWILKSVTIFQCMHLLTLFCKSNSCLYDLQSGMISRKLKTNPIFFSFLWRFRKFCICSQNNTYNMEFNLKDFSASIACFLIILWYSIIYVTFDFVIKLQITITHRYLAHNTIWQRIYPFDNG